MRREIENLKTEEELENELMALKLKMALRQYQEDKLARMMAEHDDDAAGKERLANGQDEMIRRIDRQLRKRQARRFARKTLPRFGKIAACLLLTFYVGLTVAVAAVQSVRVELLQFILSIEEKYTSFGFESTEEYIEVPSEWNGYYYPSYVPEGFVIGRIFSDEIEYEGPHQETLVFSEHGIDTRGTIDTEDAILNTMLIHGRPAMIVEKDIWTTIIWNVGNHCLIVEFTGEKEEAIKFAESVVMIRE